MGTYLRHRDISNLCRLCLDASSLLVAIGVNESGYREILGICEGAEEDKRGWSCVLKDLKERRLKCGLLILSDAWIWLAESAAEFFSEAARQKCAVHRDRNTLLH